MLSLVTLATPPFVVFGIDIGSAVPVLGSVVQWISLVASVVAIVLTIRAARRAGARDLREQVSAVFIRRENFPDLDVPTRQTTIVNQSQQSLWDVVVEEQPPGEKVVRYKLQTLGELKAGERRTHSTYGKDVRVTLIATDYQGRNWEQRVDVPGKWKQSSRDARDLHDKANPSKLD
ncbi:hypothetical protein DEJ33_15750 [Curtobacterium sp. MCPF17_047]|uniref:hypothetical protein n=1 Tax=Curtobacterium sp. MCPF17_047 TaxID=2175654 RepID=UPI000DA952C7|nr:hypothetical protein [Curtobacterium sp. MCPF17_047]PZF61886.1 hypothetical protein DEJ33_15750 [Curtobacterium sp. MCPF17_047]